MTELIFSFPLEERKKMEAQRERFKGRSNEEDCQNAKIFAKNHVKQL